MEFRILGPLEVAVEGRSLTISAPKERALLAALVLQPNGVVSTDRLVDELWDGEGPESAAAGLRVLVSRLRRLLAELDAEDRILTRAPGYLLRMRFDELDAARFEALVGRGRGELEAGDATAASATLQEALRLWRGPALAEVAPPPFARVEAARPAAAR